MPEGSSKADFILCISAGFARRGELPELFSHVRTARTKRAEEIGRIEYLLAGESTSSGRLRTAAIAALSPQESQPYLASQTINTLVTWERGRLFLLWPIPSEAVDRVPLDDLRLALTSELPVLLVTGSDQPLAWRWADAGLVDALAEAKELETTVRFPEPDGTIRAFVERTISTFERPRWRWEPEAWGRLQQRAAGLGRAVRTLGQESGTAAALQALDDAARGIEEARFIVTVAGPFRAGKSTLINALLEVAVSPVGRRPTTAVTVEFEAGNTPRSEVYFADGTRREGAADQAFLQEFVTQDANRNNKLKVRFVRVKVPSPLLAQGVVLLDAPGLQDPNDAMVRIADEAIRRAHAVIYVIDGAPFAAGGFVLNHAIVEDIRSIGKRAGRKLILLVNKVDMLDGEQQRELALLLDDQMQQYEIRDHILGAPRCISAQRAWASVTNDGSDKGGIMAVRCSLWDELLQHGEVGFRHLRDAVRSLDQATGDLTTLLAARRVRGAEAERLRAWRDGALEKVQGLHAELQRTRQQIDVMVRTELARARMEIPGQISAWLRQFSLSVKLPGADTVADEVRSRFVQAANATWSKVAVTLTGAETRVAGVIEAELRQARMAMDAKAVMLVSPLPVQIRFRTDDGVEQGFRHGLIATVLSALVGATPVLAVGWGLGAFILSWFSTKGERRARDLARLVEEIQKKAEEVETTLSMQISAQVGSQISDIRRRVDDRLGAFVSAMSDRLHEAGDAPLSEQEVARLETFERRANELRGEVRGLVDEVFRVGMERSATSTAPAPG